METDRETGRKTPDSTENIKELFSRIAKRYDLGNSIISLGTHYRFKRLAVSMLEMKPGQTLLDACCGTGDMSFLAIEAFPGVNVIGVDFSPEMIEVAKIRAKEKMYPETRLQFLEGDVTQLEFRNDSFDAAVVAFGLRNIPDKNSFFREMRRILKPGGKLIVLEFSNPKDSRFSPLYSFYLKTMVPLLGFVATGDLKAYSYLTNSIFTYPLAEEIRKIAENEGFDFKYDFFLFGGLSLYNCQKI